MSIVSHPLLRNDTMLGVCQSIGDELGFNPTWLRIAFAIAMFFIPTATLAIYLALGVVVGLVYWRLPLKAASGADATPTDRATVASNEQTEIAQAA